MNLVNACLAIWLICTWIGTLPVRRTWADYSCVAAFAFVLEADDKQPSAVSTVAIVCVCLSGEQLPVSYKAAVAAFDDVFVTC